MSTPITAPPPARILVVEDELPTRRLMVDALAGEGWAIAEAGRGREMIALLDQQTFDLVVLEWLLPGRDGLELLQHVRARGAQTPVLMVTPADGVNDRVVGLESGADDCLDKPFVVAELVARCRALLRRSRPGPHELLTCGDLQLDPWARIAVRGGEDIALSPREADLLEYLMRYQGHIVTREMLERKVWNEPHRLTSLDNVIDVQVMRLRRKIDGEHPVKLLHTVRGLGYRLAAEP